jgi:hypothetical protein
LSHEIHLQPLQQTDEQHHLRRLPLRVRAAFYSLSVRGEEMSEWITNRPPTKEEVADTELCWVTRYNGRVDVCAGKWIRAYWHQEEGHDPRAWMPLSYPKPYQPPKPRRQELWISYSHHENRDGSLRRKYDCGIYFRQPTAVESIHVREVLPDDPDPEAVKEVAEQLQSLADETDWMLTDEDLKSMARKLREKQ